jgi:hypothetical protein
MDLIIFLIGSIDVLMSLIKDLIRFRISLGQN